MPDVGILNLQIHHDSSQAEKGLNNLADALSRVKEAVRGGLKLTNVAKQIERLAQVVNDNLNDSTMSKLNEFAETMSKLQGLGDIKINIRGGNVTSTLDSILEGVENVQQIADQFGYVESKIAGCTDAVGNFANTMANANEIVQNMNFGNGYQQFRDMLYMFLQMKSAMALGSGADLATTRGVFGYLSDGAIEVEGTVSDATDATKRLYDDYVIYANGASQATLNLNSGIEETKNEIGNVAGVVQEATEAASEFAEVKSEIQKTTLNDPGYDDAIEFARQWNSASSGTGIGSGISKSAMDAVLRVRQLLESSSDIDLLNMKIKSMTQRLYEGAKSGKMTGEQIADLIGRIRDARDKVQELTEAEEAQAGIIPKLRSAFESFGDGIKKMFPSLTGLIKRFGQIAKYRMLRAILKQITEGFSEGVENLYYYSNAAGTSFAPAMDSAASSLLQMKNSIGAAVSPLLQALIPVLQTVVNWFITAVNYANQFFALLRGQATWTRAVPATTTAFKNQEKAAKGAASAIKDLLADWDELNIIQNDTAGGGALGSSLSAEEYLQMFEEVDEFDDGVKNALGFIEEHFGGIAELAKEIGILILGWKISSAFEGVLGDLGKGIFGSALVYLGVQLAYGSAYEAGTKGYFDTEEILGTLGGIFATAIGGTFIGTAVAGPAGGVVGFAVGLTVGIVASIIGWVKGSEKKNEVAKWGNLKLERDQIEKRVKEMFSFDVDALITVLDASITNTREARVMLFSEISKFRNSFASLNQKVSIGLDVNSEEGSQTITDAYESAQAAISSVQEMITKNNDGLTVFLNNFKLVNSEGTELNDELLESLSINDSPLKDYFTDIGKKMAHWMYMGQQSEWKNGELEQLLALMESQKRIYEKAEEYQNQLETNRKIKSSVSSSFKDGLLDYDSAIEQLNVQRQLIEDVEQKTRQQADELASNYNYLSGLALASAEEVGIDTEQGQKLKAEADRYKAMAEDIMAGLDEAVKKKLAETKAVMAKEWASALKVVYGEDFFFASADATDEWGGLFGWLDDLFGAGHSTKSQIERALNNGGIKEAAGIIRESLIGYLISEDTTGATDWFINGLSGNIADLLTDDTLTKIAENVIKNTNNAMDALQIFQAIFDFDDETAMGYINKALGFTVEVSVEPEIVVEDTDDVQEELRKEIEEAMGDGVIDMDEAMGIIFRFGSVEFDDMMDELGYHVSDAMQEAVEEDVDIWDLMGANKENAKAYIADSIRDAIEEEDVDIWDLMGVSEEEAKYHTAGSVARGVTLQTAGATDLGGTSVGIDDKDVADGVKEGTADGVNRLVAVLETNNLWLQRIYGKNLEVKFSPSTAGGLWQRMNNILYANVVGEP